MVVADAEFQQEGAEPLPRFIIKDESGVWVDLNCFRASSDFSEWVDRLFVRGAYFRELDYPVFLRLAYDFEPGVVADEIGACEAAGRPSRLRFARGISHILPLRSVLYRGLKISGGRAEYLFEPVSLEFSVEQQSAEANETGDQRSARTEAVVVAQKTRLDFDEFIAQMWLKGLRYGVDEAVVRKAIGEDHVGRETIAAAKAPSAGRDAGVEELSDGLRRDDAPGLLPDGRINLARFRNRFPQIRAGVKLLRKTPLVLGNLGRELNGRPLAPALPKDLDFAALAGSGTRIENTPQGEYLVATIDGFLDIDNDSSKMSVTEKIINRGGVSLRTTGDIVLMGDEYEEHGEIQEGRVVEGLNITTFADVFGKVVSKGGVVVLKKNLSGGAVVNHGGQVMIEGRASGATILAPGGEVTVRHAENSLIVGRRVVISERAVGCDILADELEIALAEASVLGAAALSIAEVRAHGSAETLVSILLPPDGEQHELLAAARAQLEGLQAADDEAKQLIDSLRGRPGVENYLTIAGKVRRQELTLSVEQKVAFQKLRDSVAPVLKALAQISEQGKARASHRETLQAAIAGVEAERRTANEAVKCSIGEISGEVIVRTHPAAPDAKLPASLAPNELKAFLRAMPPGCRPLFAGSKGCFEWRLVDDAKVTS
ncbi:DUF342 domain-containing protein [Aromatoleum diolicum]|uniref:DUF342 domain-containing protein n=2 Tax=Aromatoleum diolicum TaxID=75796 RepID=A0ABX1QCP3_9RHOO|nr:flagellar assembly protein A [Aromatoleum diolicum]NMG75290.1 DUF342 domain-containing protein [Aromatoleum diolicum]